jgi:arylsulfatase A-like enzyme
MARSRHMLVWAGAALLLAIAQGCAPPPRARATIHPPAYPLALRPAAAPLTLHVPEALARLRDCGADVPLPDIPVRFRLGQYAVFTVNLDLDGGGGGRLELLDARGRPLPGATSEAAGPPGSAPRALHFNLPPDRPGAPAVHGLRLYPAASDARVAIHAMTLGHDAPKRLDLDGETRPVYSGSRPPWRMLVPANARLTAHAGIHPRAWQKDRTDGMVFQVEAETAGEPRRVLARVTLDPANRTEHRRWVPVEADLSAYAGRSTDIFLRILPAGARPTEFAVWGGPVVHSPGTGNGGTPVVLLSCDTLRADHLPVHGYHRDTAPNLTAFAGEAVVFERCLVQDAWTLPSHMCMLTGLHRKHHGVTPDRDLDPQVPTLPRILRDAGYHTAGITGISWWLEGYRGFARGFDLYATPHPFQCVTEVHRRAVAWLDHRQTGNFFLFLHNYNIHSKSAALGHTLPYAPENPAFFRFSRGLDTDRLFRREGMPPMPASDFLVAANKGLVMPTPGEVDALRALYDDAVLEVDAALGDLFDALRARGLYDRALIIVTSDHGESFGEHGQYMHQEAYDTCARVPLLIRFPGGRFGGTRVEDPVQTVDFLPTILDTLGLDSPVSHDGQSLLAVLEGTAPPRQWAFTRRGVVNAVSTRAWKLLSDYLTNTREFYRVEVDPGESTDLHAEEPPELPLFRAKYARFYADATPGWHVEVRGGGETAELTIGIPAALRLIPDPEHESRTVETPDGLTIACAPGSVTRFRVEYPPGTLPARLRFSSEHDIELLAGEHPPARGRDLAVALEPDSLAMRMAPAVHRPELPTVMVWREPPKFSGPESPELAGDVLNELAALGYL